jgi:hypothetical protein
MGNIIIEVDLDTLEHTVEGEGFTDNSCIQSADIIQNLLRLRTEEEQLKEGILEHKHEERITRVKL